MPALEDLFDHSPWMATLTEQQQAHVRGGIVEKSFNAVKYICRKGTPTTAWFGVIDGLARAGTESEEGKCGYFFIGIQTISWFGEGSLMKREKRLYDVVALGPGRIATY